MQLLGSSADAARPFVDEFRAGLRELGYVEGRNIVTPAGSMPPYGAASIVLSVLWGWALDRIAPDCFDPSAARSVSPASA